MKTKHFALTLSLAVMLCMTSAFAQTTYDFQTINYPGDTFTQLLGINNSGDIAGYHNFLKNSGFTYSTKTKMFTTENYPGSSMTQVIGINNEPFKTSGFYVKSGKTEGFTDYQGTFATINFPKTPFNQLLSQNDYRQAAGYYSTKGDGSGPDHAYVYDETGGYSNCSRSQTPPALRPLALTTPATFAASRSTPRATCTAGSRCRESSPSSMTRMVWERPQLWA